MKKINVIVLGDPIDNQQAGIHVYTREMVYSMQKTCRRVDLSVIRNCNSEPFVTDKTYIVKERHILGFRALRMFLLIPLLIRKVKPDIVIEPAHFGPFNLPKQIKRVTIIHDLTPILYPKWHHFHHSLLQKLFLNGILKRALFVVVNSQNTLRDLQKVYPFTIEKSVCIYPGIDTFYSVTDDDQVREKQLFFMFTGTIEPRKNLETLLDAFRIFRENYDADYKLILCGGKGWKSESFYAKLAVHPFKNDIELRGYVSKEELKKLYSTTSGFIYPSLYEGFGFPVAEAMGCGAPCIVSSSSSLPEVGGDAALYFDPTNAHELALKMNDVASNKQLQQFLSEKGIQQSRKFSWGTFANEFEEVLLTISNQQE